MRIGEKIKEIRIIKKITQNQLSEGIFTRNMLSQIENGKAYPSLEAVPLLANRLGVSLEFLMNDSLNDYKAELYKESAEHIRRLFEKGDFSGIVLIAEKDKELFSGTELSLTLLNALIVSTRDAFTEGDLAQCGHNVGMLRADSGRTYFLPESIYLFADRFFDAFSTGKIPNVCDTATSGINYTGFVIYCLIINLIDRGMSERAANLYDLVKIGFEPFRYHINSRLAFANFNYERAKLLLHEMISKYEKEIPVPLLRIYMTELEDCCKKTNDYRSAYDIRVRLNELNR